MAAEKEVIILSRVHTFYYMCNPPSQDCHPRNILDGSREGSHWLIESPHILLHVQPALTRLPSKDGLDGSREGSHWLIESPHILLHVQPALTRLPSKEHLRWQLRRKSLSYRESTHSITCVTCPHKTLRLFSS